MDVKANGLAVEALCYGLGDNDSCMINVYQGLSRRRARGGWCFDFGEAIPPFGM